ncbi:uncharacterized protein LOC127252184 isoform X3 [Andrographis paniculata]|uniref:uncharacterized protein LOC127252184 isoform X3 n=1 Tax=Andrographis paniculata TaxID=175694 RepID=UPI0021E75E20|nr:uncharacterized protein LOC127252184 isoform X3 [Andrographis paniculata]
MKRSQNPNKPPAPSNLILEEVVGLTTRNGNGLASNASSSKFAYIAGCVVVLHNVCSGIRSHLMAPNRVLKPLSCVTLSPDASIVAAGQSGYQPGVLVWNSNTLAFLCELKGHQYGVECMALSPDGKYLVSIGFPRDGCICFWDWKNKILTARIKISSVSCPTASIVFSSDSKYILSADKNQLKVWKVRWPKGFCSNPRPPSVTMHKKVDLGRHKDSTFVAVSSMSSMDCSSVNHIHASEQAPFYAVTEKGMLCMVHPNSPVINSVDLEVTKCFALATSTSLVACACNNGLVKLFGTKSLEYAGRLLYAEGNRCKKSTMVDYKMDMKQFELQNEPTFPDAVACQFSTHEKLVVIYEDHSLYIWDVHSIDQATRCCVLVSHGGCIWGIKNVPCENMHDPSLSCVAKGCSGGLSFATCSVDGNIRLWDFAPQSEISENGFTHCGDGSSNGDTHLVNAGIFERDSVAEGLSSTGFRSMAISSDGKYLAAGDFRGDIHIFDLYTSDYIFIKDAHDSEICSLSFNLADKNKTSFMESWGSHLFLASAGRKSGTIHLYDADRNFILFGTLNHHSSVVTSVKVSSNGHQILSCADRYLTLHSIDVHSTGCKFSCLKRIATSGIIYDMDVDHRMNVACTVGEDKKINVYDIQSGKQIKRFNHDGNGDTGNPVKVTVDGSCSYVACSYSNRYINIYDCVSGKVVAQAAGHGKFVTGIIFSPDCKHLVSVGADGCIFVWSLPTHMSSRMLLRTKETPVNDLPESINQPIMCNHIKSYLIDDHKWKDRRVASLNGNLKPICEEMPLQELNSPESKGFKFSISRLPKWAQCKFNNNSLHPDIESSSSKVDLQNNNEPLESSRDALESGQQFSGTLSGHLPQTESCGASPTSQTFSRPSENRWLTIHTVCMDLLDSPESWDSAQSQAMETIHPNKRIKLMYPVSGIANPPEESSFKQHKHSSFSQGTAKDTDASRKGSQENEYGEAHLRSLSVQLKDEKGELPTKTGNSSQFPLQRHLLGVEKRSSPMLAAEDSIYGSLGEIKSSNSKVLSIKPSMALPVGRAFTEDAQKPPQIPLQKIDNDKIHEVEDAGSWEEALCNLEAAAENALQSFHKLAAVNITVEDKSSMAEAATRLPLIEKKIQAITRLLQPDRHRL